MAMNLKEKLAKFSRKLSTSPKIKQMPFQINQKGRVLNDIYKSIQVAPSIRLSNSVWQRKHPSIMNRSL